MNTALSGAVEATTLGELLGDGLFTDGDWVETKDQDPAGDVRLIQLADIGDGVFRDRSSRFLTMEKARQLRCTFLKAGDVLVARMPEPLGRACIFPEIGQPAVTAVDVCILRPNPARVLPAWLAKAINSPSLRAAMQQFVRGTTRQRISRRNLGTLVLRVPSLERQLELTSRIDELEPLRLRATTHLESADRALLRFKQSVLSAACSGRLTADWRDAHDITETARDVIERSQAMVTKVGARRSRVDPWTVPDWLDLPPSWDWAPMRDLALIKGGLQKQPKRAPRHNHYPYLRVANVLRGRLDLSELHEFELYDGELEAYRLERGDLLIVEGNGSQSEIGRGALWSGEIANCVHQNHIIRVRCAFLEPGFVELFWNSPLAARAISSLAVTSAGLYSLSTRKIGTVAVPVAPLEEQQEIVRRASRLLSLADQPLSRLKAVSDAVRRSPRAILAQAFRDELELS